jgi:hypothetical protein
MTTFGSSQDLASANVTTETKTVQSGRTRVYGLHYAGTATGVYGLHYAGTATAGVIELKDGGSGGTSKIKINKPAAAGSENIVFPAPILFKTDVYSTFTTEQVTAITVYHSGGNNS